MAPRAFPPCRAYRPDHERSTGRSALKYGGFSLHNEPLSIIVIFVLLDEYVNDRLIFDGRYEFGCELVV